MNIVKVNEISIDKAQLRELLSQNEEYKINEIKIVDSVKSALLCLGIINNKGEKEKTSIFKIIKNVNFTSLLTGDTEQYPFIKDFIEIFENYQKRTNAK